MIEVRRQFHYHHLVCWLRSDLQKLSGENKGCPVMSFERLLTPIREVYNFCRFWDIIPRRMELVSRNDMKNQMSICTHLTHLSAKFQPDKPTEHCTITVFLTSPRALRGKKKITLSLGFSWASFFRIFVGFQTCRIRISYFQSEIMNNCHN